MVGGRRRRVAAGGGGWRRRRAVEAQADSRSWQCQRSHASQRLGRRSRCLQTAQWAPAADGALSSSGTLMSQEMHGTTAKPSSFAACTTTTTASTSHQPPGHRHQHQQIKLPVHHRSAPLDVHVEIERTSMALQVRIRRAELGPAVAPALLVPPLGRAGRTWPRARCVIRAARPVVSCSSIGAPAASRRCGRRRGWRHRRACMMLVQSWCGPLSPRPAIAG